MDRWTPIPFGAGEALVVPAGALLSTHPAVIAAFLDDALHHPEGRAALARWLGVGDDELDDPVQRARAAQRLRDGSWVAIEVGQIAELPRDPDTPTDPIGPADPDRPRPDRPTWIAITIVDEDGRGYANSSWTLTTADGDDRRVRLDDRSTWRADDLRVAGTCTLRVGASLSEPTSPAPGFTSVPQDAPWIGAEPHTPGALGGSVPLRTAAAHTIVVVRGRTEITVLDAVGRPEPNEWCEVTIDGRVQRRHTDDRGLLAIWHPRSLDTVAASFVFIPGGAIELERSVALPSEADSPGTAATTGTP